MELSRYANRNKRFQWTTEILKSTHSLTFTFHRFFIFPQAIDTANPANVQHILKTNFINYEKGPLFRTTFYDFLGNGIFNVDGETWKFQRQVASHEFNTKSLRRFIETVVNAELHNRLEPILMSAVERDLVLDLQDVLQRFAFDNICQIAFGYDPGYLSLELPQTAFAYAFDHSTVLTIQRYISIFPLWRVKKYLQLGSENELKNDIAQVRDLARKIVMEKMSTGFGDDLLSRFLKSGHIEEKFVVDIVISFILAGRDTTSAALTWFFWLIYNNPRIEFEILKEINNKSDSLAFEEIKELTYTHAALLETMRLYPPVPGDAKQAMQDDILPDGTKVKKGMIVAYVPYAMGRMEKLWGTDWEEFKPERWLLKDEVTGIVKLVVIDSYKYPVFQAGPRVCLGKEMAFLQMKMLVAGILTKFKVVPAVDGFEPVFEAHLTTKMKGGFPVRFQRRDGIAARI